MFYSDPAYEQYINDLRLTTHKTFAHYVAADSDPDSALQLAGQRTPQLGEEERPAQPEDAHISQPQEEESPSQPEEGHLKEKAKYAGSEEESSCADGD
ncbi:hypothetical protein JDV02_000330 [Purpureocillium takamizusanense]|uniref:Uncharacterized protein n=1 Tax=Purpureocillium takamizusanense TaxID=2060973 RepID=A0A9Q8Q755_9HYPO|nr:uncharacterized protein JDV02_000330 [Purpureocillium takamizusanense]UNI13603.1 hypothetical protein JDV02_000330 [Purpureocillium takamizusanense]